ncbi:hypothetical protein SLEP1_g955 [Rubroshorea leprosula]|uniref:Uncharacterized protein n=1 Tax=Rubroshorea leprosula TaxID=152421 RepID=A0AAV5HJ13_9ROSI|nr:hypothetical protein SLEP1_g955 [Rubroshorea leprosula]
MFSILSFANPGERSPSGNGAKHNLLKAAFKGDLPQFKRLLNELHLKDRSPATIASIKDGNGLTALHTAASGGGNQICKYLVEDLKIDVNLTDKSGLTPLHYASKFDRFHIAKYLLKNGANPNAMNDVGRISLHFAAESGSKKLVKLLMSKGADLNAVADCGTPLLAAAFHGNKDCVEILLDSCVDPNFVSRDMLSPLTVSVGGESIECVKLLLKAGADPNLCPPNGMTPLGFAASKGLTEIVKCLLNSGADPNAISSLSGVKPIEEAAANYNREVVMILLPVTSPIPTVSDWSYAGIMRHVNSKEINEEIKQQMKDDVMFSKSKAEELLNRKDYYGAIACYTKLISADPADAEALANRSLCWAQLETGDAALEDALHCIKLRPDWEKGYFRAGMAWMLLRDFEKAADIFYDGWKLDLLDKELERAFW